MLLKSESTRTSRPSEKREGTLFCGRQGRANLPSPTCNQSALWSSGWYDYRLHPTWLDFHGFPWVDFMLLLECSLCSPTPPSVYGQSPPPASTLPVWLTKPVPRRHCLFRPALHSPGSGSMPGSNVPSSSLQPPHSFLLRVQWPASAYFIYKKKINK
jgi:hypothetical protein